MKVKGKYMILKEKIRIRINHLQIIKTIHRVPPLMDNKRLVIKLIKEWASINQCLKILVHFSIWGNKANRKRNIRVKISI